MHILHIDGHWKDGRTLGAMVEESIAAGYAEAQTLGETLSVSSVRLRHLLVEDFNPETDEIPKGAASLLEGCKRADGILFSSPVMGGGTTPKMREALGYLYKLEYPLFELTGKPFGVIVSGKEDGGRSAALDIAGQPIIDLCMVPVPAGVFYHITDGADRSEGGWMKRDHTLVMRNLVRYIVREHSLPAYLHGWDQRAHNGS